MQEKIGLLFSVLVAVIVIAGLWKTFVKAGQPGWGAIIPFFNVYLMLKIAGRPGWWLLLFFIPLVNFVIMIIVSIDIAKAFGHGVGYALGLTFIPIIFYPMLGFGSSTYTPRAA
ncbi:MAG: hypothetical protein KCHDKBKB_01776 [Elusimicrobia bacterium]|nr:hypothetical protein [Elusimicrobiota bacterium]